MSVRIARSLSGLIATLVQRRDSYPLHRATGQLTPLMGNDNEKSSVERIDTVSYRC